LDHHAKPGEMSRDSPILAVTLHWSANIYTRNCLDVYSQTEQIILALKGMSVDCLLAVKLVNVYVEIAKCISIIATGCH